MTANQRMQWNRTATAWLVRRFVDPEALVEEHCADETTLTPESAGLRAISQGFPLVVRNDHETLARAAFLYDALYVQLRVRPAVDTQRPG